jgi:hypothetical protein
MNAVIMRKIDVTGAYAPLADARTPASVTISCPPDNVGNVTFKARDDSGDEVSWAPGERHAFTRIDLAAINIQGTPGDVVTVIGQSG